MSFQPPAFEAHPSLADIYHKIGKLEGKLDAFLERASRLDTDMAELDARVSVLEALRGKILGAAAVVSMIASFIFSSLDFLVGK